MAADHKAIVAGAKYFFYGILDTDGHFIGSSATAPTAGATAGSGMARLEGAKTVPISMNDAEVVTATGDDEALMNFSFDSPDLPNGILELAVLNMDFEALCQGLIVQDIGNVAMVPSGNPQDADRKTFCMIIQGQAKSYTSGSVGVARYQGVFIPSATITPLHRDAYTERAVGTWRYAMTLNKGDRLAWGATLSNALNGTEKASFIPFTSPYPLHQQRWTGNNAQTVYTLAYTPAGTSISTDVFVYIEGVRVLSGVTVDATAKTLTFGAAPAASARITCTYQMSV
jgi:hypothetical protein